ncbi:peroxisomal N(1)-acetyl-spermine/spermidine oxidase-like [Stomoxys calcitrans]|uniref:peroxisomal N(1)-acetyl-spermine/spermidine oxidase-like n=1 Tax=Stomoxys calcitrans TaxID=35570 RepID=UPI0027E2A7E8|nr:peroxisomal N(1)-acetyl-spermine/spermidine oxidase-like [Stomoxys calcitrans]
MCFRSIINKYFHKKKKSADKAFDIPSYDSYSSEESSLVVANNSSMTISIPEEPRIIVIGAGAAGLACATKLLEFGFQNLLILEAENRIGGRIYTQSFADNVIDLGAQWVHGEVNNIVYEMVQDHEWLDSTGEIYKSFECIRSNGEVVPVKIRDRLKEIFTRIIENCSKDLSTYNGSFGDYLSEQFQEAISKPAMSDIDLNVAEEFFENFKKIESSETSSGMEQVSAKDIQEYWQCPGDYLLNWKDKGFVTFLHLLMGSNEESIFGTLEERIRFNCRVDHIQWDNLDGKAFVRCNKGADEFVADHVVVTVSLGVLKDHADSLFHPPLPLHKKEAIVGLGYGSVAKIFLEFAAPFWPSDWYGFTLLWRKDDLRELQHTSYAWVEEIFGFYCVNYQPRVLLAWQVGSCVLNVEQMALDEVKSGCMYLLRRFLCQWQIPEPLNIKVSQWQSNPNFLGAYSFRSMLSEKLQTSALELSQPLLVMMPEHMRQECSAATSASALSLTELSNEQDFKRCSKNVKPLVLFAGEATSKHHYSTVHGAVESGYREANRLNYYYSK